MGHGNACIRISSRGLEHPAAANDPLQGSVAPPRPPFSIGRNPRTDGIPAHKAYDEGNCDPRRYVQWATLVLPMDHPSPSEFPGNAKAAQPNMLAEWPRYTTNIAPSIP
jgi:hypothetical protein